MYFGLLQIIFSPIFDLIIFYEVTKISKKIKDYFFVSFILMGLIIIELVFNLSDYYANFIEIIAYLFYFELIRKFKNIKLLIGGIFIFSLLDLILGISTTISIFLVPSIQNNGIDFLVTISIEVLLILLFKKIGIGSWIKQNIIGENGILFLFLIAYILISGEIVYYFTLTDNYLSEVLRVSVSLLLLQTIFVIILYLVINQIQKGLLTRQEQEKQKIEKDLAIARQKEVEAKNNELALKQEQIKKENAQLKEYSGYLEKNEDDLRRFKHDYQNILNSLKLTAEEGNSDKVVKLLDKYSKNQIDPKALRKYKGVNHIKVEELKSIAIAKLSKLYSWNINYAFGCDVEIREIPKSVDILDLTRIIGIAFDNAAEESKSLNEELGDNSARVEAIYYQENGDFEFEINNKVRPKEIDTAEISKKNYTTKKDHMGLGLANLKEIADKYKDTMIVNYGVNDGKFTFNLTILPDE